MEKVEDCQMKRIIVVVGTTLLAHLMLHACQHDVVQSIPESDNIFWQQMSLDSTRVTAMANGMDGAILAANNGGRLFRSGDSGLTWTAMNWGPAEIIGTLAINEDGHIFAATHGALLGKLYRSLDNGESWTRLNLPWAFFVYEIGFPAPGQAFLVTPGGGESQRGGMFRSDDNGQTWAEVPFPALFPFALELTANGKMYVATHDRGVCLSTDGGKTWQLRNNGLPDETMLSMASDGAENVYVGVLHHGLFRSSNGGASWTRTALRKVCVTDLVVNRDGGVFAIVGSWDCGEAEGVYFSGDRGASWVRINGGLTEKYVSSSLVTPTGYVFLGTHSSGIFKSIDSTTP